MSARVAYRRRDANASDAIAAILHPDEGYREKQQRKGVTPKDFARENKLRVKRIQAENRERRREEEAKQQQQFKLSKFKKVRARVLQDQSKEHIKRHDFLRRGGQVAHSVASEPGSMPSSSRTIRAPHSEPPGSMSCSPSPLNSPRRIHRKAPVPSVRELERREEELAKMTKKEPVDFINANAWEVIRKTPSTRFEKSDPRPVNSNYGRIPRYLLARKEQWAREEEERRKNAPDPDCPPGMVPIDEEERIRTLEVLRKSLTEAQQRMNTLPLRLETFTQIRRKNELETKLREIEDAIKVFDRPKVYVAAPLVNDRENKRECTGSIAA